MDILRPLRLRVEITEDRLELLRKEAKDEPLYHLMCKMKDSVGTEPILNYNNFIVEVENAAKKRNIKLTTKRIKAIRNYFTIVDEQAEPVKDNKGGYESDKDLKDNEQIPYKYEGGIEAFYKNEILPYVPDAWIDENSITLGYELSFTKYFYKPVQLREVADIIADIKKIEADTDGLLASIVGGIS